MFKNCRKEDLRIVALELGETVAEKVTIVELTEIIKENKYFKENVELLKELIQHTIEDRKKAEEDRKKEAENRLREKELELARLHVGVNSDNQRTQVRFIDNCRSKVKKRGPLTTSEVNDAETWLIKQDQSGINLSDPSEAAVAIIRDDIRSSVVETRSYPPPSKMLIKENQEK
ncbi:hypothetical protein TNIN_416931 [Trichonephila inaurata madagascariensis]|uniref:Uncharacterized protein n=1 Tax=Trichonephila inaurata madagascariensis TaxID=2747483 RepID=A0A8X7BTX1_9ARAC|nr:hypothetical protein TNIN_416931 [Trichonephila inaurata madagascariensis]